MTTINDINDLVRILKDNPEWVETLRGILLTAELLALPERFSEFVRITQEHNTLVDRRLERLESDVAELKAGQARLEDRAERLETGQARLEGRAERLEAGQARLEGRAERLEAGQARLETGQARLEGNMGNLIGRDYEERVARLAPRRLREQMKIEDAQPISDIARIADAAAQRGAITSEQADELEDSDLSLLGRNADGSQVYVLAEVSVTVHTNDVSRAKQRAGILEEVDGFPVIPAVIGASISGETADYAARENVTFIRIPQGRNRAA